MNQTVGWGLAVLAVAVGWVGYGWPGLLLAVTVLVFWLLLQFSRALRVMRRAGRSPVGHVDSAVMLQARLQPGMTLLQVMPLTGSLGRKLADEPPTWAWRDGGGSQVVCVFDGSKLQRWELLRDDDGAGRQT